MESSTQFSELISQMIRFIKSRFSLREDKADDAVIDEGIRSGVVMSGTNLWVLIFAILIASIGLNVNSTAVIIGAMLISPLMGPILGIGYSVGIYDFNLLRKSLLNIGIATLIGLITSTIYFSISPLTTIESEILARTTPTIWDVLIAVCGGFAGIIAVTRKEKSNVIPGVAIATALMPPLCTAGFGLATGNWEFMFGAFYLFTINCVFITFASFILVWYLKLPYKKVVNQKLALSLRRWITAIVLITMIPSIYLAYQMVNREIFKSAVSKFVVREFHFNHTHVVDTVIDAKNRKIEVTLIGDLITKDAIDEITDRMRVEGIGNATLVVHQADNQKMNISSLTASVTENIFKNNIIRLQEQDETIKNLQNQIDNLKGRRDLFLQISKELNLLYPSINHVYLSDATAFDSSDHVAEGKNVVILYATSTLTFNDVDRKKIHQLLKMRCNVDDVVIVIDSNK